MANSTSQTPFRYTAPTGQSIVAFSGSVVNVPRASGGNTDVVATLAVSFA